MEWSKELQRAQTACLETFHASGQILAQEAGWHDRAQRLTNVAYRRVEGILRDLDQCRMVDGKVAFELSGHLLQTQQITLPVAFALNAASRRFADDMYKMAEMHLDYAQETFGPLLDNLREQAEAWRT